MKRDRFMPLLAERGPMLVCEINEALQPEDNTLHTRKHLAKLLRFAFLCRLLDRQEVRLKQEGSGALFGWKYSVGTGKEILLGTARNIYLADKEKMKPKSKGTIIRRENLNSGETLGRQGGQGQRDFTTIQSGFRQL